MYLEGGWSSIKIIIKHEPRQMVVMAMVRSEYQFLQRAYHHHSLPRQILPKLVEFHTSRKSVVGSPEKS